MSAIAALIEKARSLGATFEVQGESVKVKAPEPLPEELMDALRQHKGEVIALLQTQDSPRPTMRDIPFPSGYKGLPQDPVALGEKVMDALDIHEPVLRKYNVLSFVTSWLLHQYQNTVAGRFDDPQMGRLYQAVKEEKARLGAILRADYGRP